MPLPPRELWARWERRKAAYLAKLRAAVERGEVDEDILPLLNALNELRWYYTTSSCSGRIQVAATRLPGEKTKMVVIAKWHRPVSPDEVRDVLRRFEHPYVWLAVHAPILHVVCSSLEAAWRLLTLARNTGFKHSGIQGLKKRVVVEIAASERIEAPLRLNGVEVFRAEELDTFINICNEVLLKGKEKLRRFTRMVACGALRAPRR